MVAANISEELVGKMDELEQTPLRVFGMPAGEVVVGGVNTNKRGERHGGRIDECPGIVYQVGPGCGRAKHDAYFSILAVRASR